MKKQEALEGPPAFDPPGPRGPFGPPMGWHGQQHRFPGPGPAPREEIVEEEVEVR